MKVHVVTVAANRHDHLRGQLDGLRRSRRPPDGHIVVSMGDPEIKDVCGPQSTVVACPADPARLPLARARNVGATAAIAQGTELLIFLDVDCVPGPALVHRYVEVAQSLRSPALLSGPVTYLPPPSADGYDLSRLDDLSDPHPARPMPPGNGAVAMGHDLFWSLSFAATPLTWTTVGGYCERYTGYGAEDTDFGQLARKAGVRHLAVGGADAYHQWHPTGDPPVQHLDDIVRNGRIFRERWGWWPMAGWLETFRELGLMTHDVAADDWQLRERRG